jgi:hypothetical protein
MTSSPSWRTQPLSRSPTSRSSPTPPAPGRALVTANIKDFIPLDARYRAASQAHAGLTLVSSKTFTQDRSYTAAIIGALSALLDEPTQLQAGQVTFLSRQ